MTHSGKLSRKDYFVQSVCHYLANGMCMCFTKRLKEIILPFPDTRKIGHDDWIGFCALNDDSAYYLHDELVKYRIHDNNASVRKSLPYKKRITRSVLLSYNLPYDRYNLSTAMLQKMDSQNQHNRIAIQVAESFRCCSLKQIEAIEKPMLPAVAQLIRLYLCDANYRHMGKKHFISQMLLVTFARRILLHSDRKYQH